MYLHFGVGSLLPTCYNGISISILNFLKTVIRIFSQNAAKSRDYPFPYGGQPQFHTLQFLNNILHADPNVRLCGAWWFLHCYGIIPLPKIVIGASWFCQVWWIDVFKFSGWIDFQHFDIPFQRRIGFSELLGPGFVGANFFLEVINGFVAESIRSQICSPWTLGPWAGCFGGQWLGASVPTEECILPGNRRWRPFKIPIPTWS